MDISIIIISWNTLAMTRACLESVYANLGALQAEIILVDNASSDGSADMVAKEFPHVRLIRNPVNSGFASANNLAIDVATGRHILLLNSDTIVLGDVLEKSVAYVDANPEVGAMGCKVLNTDRTTQWSTRADPTLFNLIILTSGVARVPVLRWLDRYQDSGWDRNQTRDVDVVMGCYLLIRATALAQVGKLDEAFFFYGEDADWCKRFRDAGWKVRMAPVGEIIHHGSGSAKKYNHRRDLMLTSGLVRWQRKHHGLFMALLTAGVLYLFNVSRLLYWALLALVTRATKALERRNHFWGVVREYKQSWPRMQGA